jgi:hypothetical protein
MELISNNYPTLIANIITNGIIFICVWFFIKRPADIREKFYTSILSRDPIDMLHFLMQVKGGATLLGEQAFVKYLQEGLRQYCIREFAATCGTYVKELKGIFDMATREVESKAPGLRRSDSYWKPIYTAIKGALLHYDSSRFAWCYVYSLDDEQSREEKIARDFFLSFYNECANSRDEKVRAQFYLFVESVNTEIDKYQQYAIPQERKDFLNQQRLVIKEQQYTKTEKSVWAISNK